MNNNVNEIVEVEVFTNMVDATAEEIAKKQGATTNTTENTTATTENIESTNTTTESTSKDTKDTTENTTSNAEAPTDDNGNPIDMSNVINAANGVNGEDREGLIAKAQGALQGLISYITSFRFKKDLNTEAKELGVKPKYLKGTKLYSLMQGLADTLHLGITITANMVMNIVDFIKSIIQTVVDLACNILRNIIDFVTLKSASIYK